MIYPRSGDCCNSLMSVVINLPVPYKCFKIILVTMTFPAILLAVTLPLKKRKKKGFCGILRDMV